ncbi:proline-serine-threonine phosphatase-interacting protein 1-like isoform X2 [Petromyzon marinus]
MLERLRDGRKVCKGFEEMLKQRACLEETYGKGLLMLAKKSGGQTEINTIRCCFMVLKQQLESVGQEHTQLALELNKEYKKMEDFRMKQKDRFTKMDNQMSSLHKQKQSLLKKLNDSKRSQEVKCRDLLEAECNRDRLANNLNAKLVEKSKQRVDNCYQALMDADVAYKQNVELIERTRIEWETVHGRATELYEQLEWERLNYARNAMWVHCNHLSQQCVKDDQAYEEVRLSLEKSDVQDDINCFVKNKQTGERRPDPFVYEGSSMMMTTSAGLHSNAARKPQLHHVPKDEPPPSLDTALYATVGPERATAVAPAAPPGAEPTRRKGPCTSELYVVTRDFTSRVESEMSVIQGNVVASLGDTVDGWMLVSLRGQEGFVPFDYLKPK